MNWKRLLAYITGLVDQELLLRNEFLVTENRILKSHQGKANMILLPAPADRIGESSGEIRTRERLGGLLKFYHREAA
jgi:hypothetical protein